MVMRARACTEHSAGPPYPDQGGRAMLQMTTKDFNSTAWATIKWDPWVQLQNY